MKNKLTAFVLIILLACSCVFAACASNVTDKASECEHEYTIRIIEEQTCERTGYSLSVCVKCGKERYEFYEASGHDWDEGRAVVLPTCTDSGLKLYTCAVCGLHKSEQAAQTGHARTVWLDTQVIHKLYCYDCERVIEEKPHEFINGSCTYCGTDYNAFLNKFNGTYGYEYFGTMQNGAGLQGLYREIDQSVRQFHNNGADADNGEVVRINYAQYGLSRSQAVSVWKTYHDDNPLYYWLSNRIGSNSSLIAVLCLDEYASGDARTRQNEVIYSKVSEMIEETCGERDAYNVAFALHDAIINRVEYTASGADGEPADWAHNVCGVLEGNGAVCEGYARTFQLLLNVCGVENVFVTGNDSNHAWNLVKLGDGEWYWYDLTWDDAPETEYGVGYTYFCATDAEFMSTHTPDSYLAEGKNFLYALPDRAQDGYRADGVGYNGTFTADGVVYTVVGFRRVKPSQNVMLTNVVFNGVLYNVIC